ncbi:MAG: DUF123 domain-containing protein [Acidilobaceae archaeon]
MALFKSYVLLLECPSLVLKTRSRVFEIPAGVYAYVGSCGSNCCKRVQRHYSRAKKMFWHIDYLSVECSKLGFYLIEAREPDVALLLATRLKHIPGFGSSDDRRSPSHLFKVEEELGGLLAELGAVVVAFARAEEEREALEECGKLLEAKSYNSRSVQRTPQED